ncbi:MAG: hypothetical protein EPO07_00170 [Verrucomicrobia bacterium]|nr:MAG: hypothetical protein EPO07_00170 [Verrucomicrobiota bacterium]
MGIEYNYDWWRSAAENLLQPLAALMKPGKADLPLTGQAILLCLKWSHSAGRDLRTRVSVSWKISGDITSANESQHRMD